MLGIHPFLKRFDIMSSFFQKLIGKKKVVKSVKPLPLSL